MPIKGLGPSSQASVGPQADVPTRPLGGAGSNLSTMGKFNLDITKPAESLGGTAEGFAGGIQAVGKAVVSVVENLPIAGLVTKPVIGAVGAVADATVGQVVKGISSGPIGKAANDAAGFAFNVATLPLQGALKALTVPGEELAKKVMEARIKSTVMGKKDIATFLWSEAPRDAVRRYKDGESAEDIAADYVGQFGIGEASTGAYSQDALANFLWTMLLDPVNIVPITKPFTVAAKAARLSAAGVDGLNAAAKIAKQDASAALKLGNKELAKRLTSEATLRAEEAVFLQKYDWAGKMYTATWGKVADKWSQVTGGRLSKELAQQPERIVGGKATTAMLDELTATTGKQNVDEALGNAVLTTVNANKAAVAETLVSTQRNVWRASSQNLVKTLYAAIGTGSKGADSLLAVQYGSERTIKDFLTDLGYSSADQARIVTAVENAYTPTIKAFYGSDAIGKVYSELTDVMSRIDVKARPDFYVNASEALGKSNLRYAVDAGVELIQRNKLNLIRFSGNEAQFVDYLSRTLQFGFRVSADKAQEIARNQWAKNAGNSRDLLNLLETGRMAAFGRSMREIALERAKESDGLAAIEKAAAGRHEAVAKAYFPELAGEEAIAVGRLFDQVAITSAAREGLTPNQWYAKYTYGVSGLSETDAAVSLVDELYSTTELTKAAFRDAKTPAEILEVAKTIKPTQRMISAGLGDQLAVETVDTAKGAFALPGGTAALDDLAPYNIIDEVVIASQPYEIIEALPGDIRVKMHLKMTASKSIDMSDPVAVANRVVFALLSPRRNLSGNAAVYQALRVGNADDLAAFVARYGDDVKNLPNLDAGASARLGKKIAEDFGFNIGAKDGDVTGIVSHLSDAARVLVLAKENPKFFLIKNGESLTQFAERLTLLNGVQLKVGSFAVELMQASDAAVGAIDAQMSGGVLKWAIDNGIDGNLIKELRDIGTKESNKYADELESLIPRIKAGENVYGPSANGAQSTLGPKTIDGSNASPFTKAAVGTLPNWSTTKAASAEVTLLEGSSFKVMNKYVSMMADQWSTVGRIADNGERIVYTGLDKMSGGQKQWFIWDIFRKQLEPHQWLHRDADKLAKPTIDQVRKAISSIRSSGGFTTGRQFEGVDPRIMAEFLEERGGQVLGKAKFYRNGKSAIELFKGADITTAIHEIGHIGRRNLSDVDQQVVLEVYGAKGGWTTELEEKFAKDFTNYMYTGRAPTPGLVDLFGKIRQFMADLWSKVSKTEQVHPELRSVFDRMLSHNGPQPLPDADTWSRITLISERSLTQNARDAVLKRVGLILGETDGSETLRSVDDATVDLTQRIDGGVVVRGDGATFNPIRNTVQVAGEDFGFMNSPFLSRSVVLKGADRERFLTDKAFQKEVLGKYLTSNEDLLSLDNHYIGLYDDAKVDTYYIDVSIKYDSVQEAIEAGTRAQQQSVFRINDYGKYFLDTPLGRLAAERENAKITRSALDISPAEIEKLSKPRIGADQLESSLRPIADELVEKYDDVAAVWWNKGGSAADIVDWVRNHPEVTVRELTETEARLLPDGFKSRQADISLGGYRYGVAPKGGIIERTTRVSDGFGGTRIATSAQPFVDLLDTTAINKLDEVTAGINKRRGFLDKFRDNMLREYGPDVVRTNYVERFVTEITKKTKINAREAETILARVGNLAARKETTMRGLWFERDQVQTIFREVLGDAEYFKYIENNDPLTDLLAAAAGDVSVVGLLPGFSGRAKAWKPVMGAVTDRAFPLFRFGKGNPFFRQILEPIETKMMGLIDRIKADQVDEFLGDKPSKLVRRMTEDSRSVTNEIAESVFYDQEKAAVSAISAVREKPAFNNAVSRVLKAKGAIKDGVWAINNPEEYKLMIRDIMASEWAVNEMYDLLKKAMPETFEQFAEAGLTDGRTVMARILEDGMIQSSPEAFAAVLRRDAGPTIGLWSKAVAEAGMSETQARAIAAAAHGVFTDAMIRGTRRANKYQFFSSYRSWFERSINHPFLGIYPYSYMTQKAIPWMLKMLFAPKIAGHVRPGFGYINAMRLQEALIVDANTDRGFMTTIAEARPLWYALNIMVPATPTNLGFAAPYWLRKGVLTPAQQNKPLDFAQLSKIPELVGETVIRGTILGQGGALLGGVGAFGDAVENDLEDIQLDVNRFFNP